MASEITEVTEVVQKQGTILLKPVEPAQPHPSTLEFQEKVLRRLDDFNARIIVIESKLD